MVHVKQVVVETLSNGENASSNPLEAEGVMPLKIMVTGASGLLGYKLADLSTKKGHEVYSVYKEHKPSFGEPLKLDLTVQRDVAHAVSRLKPEAIVHTAAYTDVDGCEVDKEKAWKVNAEAARNIAMAAQSVHAHLTYVSTDYVFNGEKGLYREDDQPNPISFYGYTKLKGEEFTREHAEEWCIVRTSVLYGWGQPYRANFATWLINNLTQAKEVKVLTDQYVSPTLNTNLAEMLLEIAENKMLGIIHGAGATRTSRYEFAVKIAEAFDLNKDLIKPAEMQQMSWKAKRPKDSSLNVDKAEALLNAKPKKLSQALKVMKNEGG